jgi:hypothetical protein
VHKVVCPDEDGGHINYRNVKILINQVGSKTTHEAAHRAGPTVIIHSVFRGKTVKMGMLLMFPLARILNFHSD